MVNFSTGLTIFVSLLLFCYAIHQLYKQNQITQKAILYVRENSNRLATVGDFIEEAGITGEWELAWQRYRNSMLSVPGINNEPQVYTSIKPEKLFALESTQKLFGLDLRAINSLPSNLTGLGITFTFAGLVFGVLSASASLSGVVAGTDSNLLGMIEPLLGGAGVAFSTSLAGLAGSLIYGVGSQRNANNLQDEIEKWNNSLREIWPTIEWPTLQLVLAAQQDRQLDKLDQISSSVASSVASAMADILGDIRSGMLKRDEASAEMFGKKFDSLIGCFNNNIESMVVNFDTSMESMSVSFDTSIDKLTKNFNRSIRKMAGDEMEHFAGQLKDLHKDYVEAQRQIVSEKNEFLARALDQTTNVFTQTKDISDLLEKSAGLVADLAENMVEHVNDMRDELDSSGKLLANHIEATSKMLTGNAMKAGETLISASEESKRILVEASLAITDSCDNINGMLALGAEGFGLALKKSGAEISQVVAQGIKAELSEHQTDFNAELKGHIKAQGSLWLSHEQALTRIYQSHNSEISDLGGQLASTFTHVGNELKQFECNTSAYLKSLENDAGQILKTLSQSLDEMQPIPQERQLPVVQISDAVGETA